MGSKLQGKWTLEDPDSDNFDKYMKCLNVSMLLRKAAVLAKPEVEIIMNGDVLTICTRSLVKSTELNCRLNKEFEEITGDGRKCMTIITLKGDKLTQEQKWDGNKSTITREMSGDKMITTLVCEDVTCKRVYCRQS
ncbi:myelin P2 protein-like [Gastrophryne carolinensis]